MEALSSIFPSGVGGDPNRATRRVDIGIIFIIWPETPTPNGC